MGHSRGTLTYDTHVLKCHLPTQMVHEPELSRPPGLHPCSALVSLVRQPPEVLELTWEWGQFAKWPSVSVACSVGASRGTGGGGSIG